MKVKSLSLVLTPSDPMDCSLPRSSVHGIFQARVLGAIAFSTREGERAALSGMEDSEKTRNSSCSKASTKIVLTQVSVPALCYQSSDASKGDLCKLKISSPLQLCHPYYYTLSLIITMEVLWLRRYWSL